MQCQVPAPPRRRIRLKVLASASRLCQILFQFKFLNFQIISKIPPFQRHTTAKKTLSHVSNIPEIFPKKLRKRAKKRLNTWHLQTLWKRQQRKLPLYHSSSMFVLTWDSKVRWAKQITYFENNPTVTKGIKFING